MKKKILISAIGVLLLSGCGKKDDKKNPDSTQGSTVTISPQVLRIGDTAFTENLVSSSLKNGSLGLVGSDLYTTDVVITSLKYPIASISLSNKPTTATGTASGNLSFDVYTCTGTTVESCLVDLKGDALKNLLASAPAVNAKVGTFSQINIGMCPGGLVAADTFFLLKASVTLGGTLYYTNATTGLSTTGPEEEVKIFNGGGCGSVSHMPVPLVIGESDITVDPEFVKSATSTEGGTTVTKTPTAEGKLTGNLDLKLYFDLKHAAYANDGSSNPGAMLGTKDCAGTNAQAPVICVNFPKIISTVDSTVPTVKRIKMDSNTIFGFYFGSSEIPFGSYQRVYFNGDLTGLNMDTLLSADFDKVTKNEDGTFKLRTLNDGRYNHFDSFKFETHTGSFDKTGVVTAYTATLL